MLAAETKDRRVIEYIPLPSLKMFHDSGASNRCVVGPFGSGKTSAVIMELGYYLPHYIYDVFGVKNTRWTIVRNCYDDETEILTEKRGWVLFKDLAPVDKVASLHGDKIKFEAPSYYYKEDYDGEMITINSQNIDLCVTPDHRLYVSTRHGKKRVYDKSNLC